MKRRLVSLFAFLLVLTFITPLISQAQDLQSFENKVTKFKLDNGFTFIVIERHMAPVASFVTFVNVGAANEPIGHTGMAHIFEHMAFKGTRDIGTKNWKKEKPLIQEMDAKYQEWLNEKYSPNPDSAKMAKLWDSFKKTQDKADQYVKNNQFAQIIDVNGGTDLNASTGADQTMFHYSLPENKVELWFSLESDRFRHPVFREFYKEKSVIEEERRRRTESSPVGRLLEEMTSVAYTASPYGSPVIGWKSDIEATTIADTKRFFNIYYVPGNITFAIAGDVNPDHIKKLAKEYFGDFPAGKPAPKMYTIEPDQRGERRFVIKGQTQPFYLMAYHTVSDDNPDSKALQLLGSIISGGRTSRLYKSLVEEKKLALQVIAFNGFPGTKYKSLFITFAVPNQGVSLDTLENAINEEIDKVKNGAITQQELDRARTNARASLIRSLDSNMGLASEFAQADAQEGSWEKVFTQLKELDQVTLDDLQRVANKYFIKSNRTVGLLKTENDKGGPNAK